MKKNDNVSLHSQLIIDAILDKFIGFTPLYRQVDRINKMGLNLTKDGLINEIVYLSEKLRPIYDDFLKEISCSKRVFGGCLPIKNFPSEKCIKKKYKLEVFISDLCNMGFTTPACIWISLPMESLHNKTVTNLKNFHGALQLSYDTYLYFLYDDRVMTISAPISTLLERLKHDSIKDSNWSGHKIVELIYELYDIENSIKGEPPQDRLKERKKKSLPRISSIYGILEENVDRFDELIGKKVYKKLLEHRDAYSAFCYNGFIDIDNSVYNETIKKIFPKYINGKYLFFSDKKMGSAASIFFSLIGTCILNNIDPKKWLTHVVQRIYPIAGKDIIKLSPLHLRGL